ncbi:MAG: hypothetical protein Tsb002_27830 [Wenzhouxiangellaceae bacterium]
MINASSWRRWLPASLMLFAALWNPVADAVNPPGWVGIIAPAKAVDIRAGLRGRLQQMHVQVGDQVNEGDLLVTIDATLLKEELAIARSTLDSARAELASADSQARHDHNRYERLRKAGAAVSAEDLDNAAADLAIATAARDAAKARMAEKQGEIERLQRSLQQAEVRAPFTGIVGLRYLESGSLVTDTSALLRLLATQRLVARFAVPPAEASALTVGQPVAVMLASASAADSGTTTTVNARLSWLAPAVDVASQMVFAEALLGDDHPGLRAGLDAWVSINAQTLAEAAP